MSLIQPVPDTAALSVLREIVSRHGTPTYAFDIRRLQSQADLLASVLPENVEVFYSLKANASLGVCQIFEGQGLGADVASAGELATALEAGFSADRIFVAGPFKSPETIGLLRNLPEAIVSIDSLSELETLAAAGLANRFVLRLRPDYDSAAVVAAGCESRFGFSLDELPRCKSALQDAHLIGFHIFSGSQILDSQAIAAHTRSAVDLSLRAAEELGLALEFLNLGGGFGIPYGPGQQPLDFSPIRAELEAQSKRVAPARVALELGRFLVAEGGWYLTTVLGHQFVQGRRAVVVDGGVHQRADLCGVCLQTKAYPPLVLRGEAFDEANPETTPTDVLGILSLPADFLAKASQLPPLRAGDCLAFENAGAYGLWSSPAIFHASPLPAEVAFDDSSIYLMRERKDARSILQDQKHLPKTLDPVTV